MISRRPSSPASTGQVPILLHAEANSFNAAGGSRSEMNSPPSMARMVCAESRDCINASERLTEAGSVAATFEMRTVTLKRSLLTQAALTSTRAVTLFFVRTRKAAIFPSRLLTGSISLPPGKRACEERASVTPSFNGSGGKVISRSIASSQVWRIWSPTCSVWTI